MTQSKFLIRTSGALALVALLSACGGSDNTPTEPEPTTPTEPPALETAVDAQRAAAAASMKAAELLAAAVKASTATVATGVAHAVDGSSQGAYDNVMTVLGATALIEAERMKAANAVMAIKGIDTSGMSADEKARIANILENAEEDLAEIVAIQNAKGAGSLAMAVADVKAGSALDDSNAKIARAKADGVAMAVETAIGNVITAGLGSLATDANDAVMMTPHAGMTFKDITGSARMAATMIGDFAEGGTARTDLGTATASGASQATAYKGIPGNLICFSATCSVGTDGKITGDVQFAPTNPGAYYVMASAGADYTPLTNVGNYGYWLNAADDAISLRADSPSTGLLWTRDADTTDTTVDDVEASYSGMAGGFSERTVGTGDNAKQSSGEFTANVMLNATFGQNNYDMNGSISGFAGGSHVNPDWYVRLDEVNDRTGDIDNGAISSASMPGKEDATTGAWTATAYGASGERPSGFVGAFHATFDDGTAAGVYSAD
ncbi:MAG: hypothetical protein F4X97_15610 [Boseongicola sp. SB0662_bin_57]|nr:hypothetical protein [Boseongicola sp. SB0662_bin_57]